MAYAAIGTIWIVVPVVMCTMGSYITDIVKGTCIPWGVFANYVAEKAITSMLVIITYLLPMILTIVCYCRIVYVLRYKVNQSSNRVFLERFK